MKKVLLGLSGGVDSAVAAYLLKLQGYDVTCCFMRNWDSFTNNDILGNPTIDNTICPQEEDYQDACKVAEILGLPMQRVDFIKEYWDAVFTTFLKEYESGRTPNPDILCNKYIKFDAFFEYGMKQGFDFIATGHYARVIHEKDESFLLRGIDENKDQSYFLCQLPKSSLRKTLFPIGELTKQEVREIAISLNLNVAKKKDSTGICFIGERNFKQFLQNYLPAKPGDIYDINTMKCIAKHDGVLYYTIGQRKGLGIGGQHGPWIVVGKNIYNNRLYVSNVEDKKLIYANACIITDCVFLSELEAKTAKFRYRQKDNDVIVERLSETECLIKFNNDIASVTPGQYAVLYNEDICIGGGVIDKVFYNGQNIQALIYEKEKQND